MTLPKHFSEELWSLMGNKKSIFKTFAIYYICMAVFCGIRIIASLGYMPEGKLGDVVFTLVIQVVVLFLLPLTLYCLLIKVRPRQVFKTCNFDKVNINVILISFVIATVFVYTVSSKEEKIIIE